MSDLVSNRSRLIGRDRTLPAGFLRAGLVASAALVLVWSLARCFFVVQPTEMAGVRSFGTVVAQRPVGPGIHFKLPWETADHLQVSLTTVNMAPYSVPTIDNQPITLNLSLVYRIPENAVFRLLYSVGRAGNTDIVETILPIASDRASKVIAHYNTIRVSESRDQIGQEIAASIAEAVRQDFGIEIVRVNIASITYSPGFVQSVEAAMTAKNAAIAAENAVRTKEAQAQQAVAEAKGQAEAAIQQARGRAESLRLDAQGQADAKRLLAQAEAEAYRRRIEAVGSPDKLVELMRAEALQRWNGSPPQVSGANGLVPMIDLREHAAK